MSKQGYQIEAAGQTSTVYIYGGIGFEDSDGMAVDPAEFVAAVEGIQAENIDVRIASVGGDPVRAGQMYQALVDHPAKVRTIVDSKAFSAGSMLLQAGDVRVARPLSVIMVHGPATEGVPGRGTAQDHRQIASAIEAHSEAMVPAYTRHGIEAGVVREWLTSDEDTYFSAAQALEANLIDEVAQKMPMAASAPEDYRIAAMGGLVETAADGRVQVEKADMADEKDAVIAASSEKPTKTDTIVASHSRTIKKATEQGVKAEAARRGEVAAVFEEFYDADPLNPITAIHDSCLNDTACDKINAQAQLLSFLAKGTSEPILAQATTYEAPAPAAPPRASRYLGGAMQVSRDQQDLRAEGLQKAFQIKAGLITDRNEIDSERRGQFLAMSLTDVMSQELRASGYNVSGMREDIARQYINAMPILAAGPSQGTDHLPAVLGNIANLSAMQGWDSSEETWQQWTTPGTVSNYQPHTRANIAMLDKLVQMLENQQWEYGGMADVKQRITAYFHGRKYSLSIQAIANDEIGELTRAMQGWGEVASATVGDSVYGLLTAAGTGGLGQIMDEDSTVLFHANHGNYVASGAGGVPTEALLNAGRSAMVAQSDPNGRKIAARPRYVIHGPALWSTVRKALNSEELQSVTVDGATGATVLSGSTNTARDMNLTPIEEYRFTGNEWLLAAARRTVEVAGVGGPVMPRANQAMVSDAPGITYELSMPFGVAALDFRGIRYNHGA